MIDYQAIMGVKKLSALSEDGSGARIAVLDSGIPTLCVNGAQSSACSSYVEDKFGHATAVASILAGGRGIIGLCGRAEMLYMPVLDSSGRGSVKSVADGIYRAIDAGVDLINLSLGFLRTEECPTALKMACDTDFRAKKTIICAAGNDGGLVNWPAALRTTICVGSTGRNGLRMPFSSIGEVDFVAPGLDLSVLDVNGSLRVVSGTSFSTALVTGVAALLVSKMKARGRESPMPAVRNELRAFARDVYSPGWDEGTGFGLISGKIDDPTVDMKIRAGFFDRMLSKIKSLFGISKGATDGRF